MRALIWSLALSGCASATPPTREPPPEPAARAWFGVRGTHCEAVLPVLGLASALRGGTVSPWQVSQQGPWCAVAAAEGGAGLRIDSMAQHLSLELGASALSLYLARAAWSVTVFDRGEVVWSLESHLGEPLASGDAVRAATVLAVDAAVLSEAARGGRDLGALMRFSKAIGLTDPGAEARRIEVARPAEKEGGEDARVPTLARIPPGAWAALPPLGVVLVKAVEPRDKDGVVVPTYVLVNDMSTLELPVASAEAMGLRPIASAGEVDSVLAFLTEGVEIGDEDYDAERVKGWLEAMRQGELQGIARVYAALCDLQSERRLFQVEEGLLATSREWLAEEIATAKRSQVDTIDAQLRKLCD